MSDQPTKLFRTKADVPMTFIEHLSIMESVEWVEPVGTLTSTAGGTGRITYNVDTDGVLVAQLTVVVGRPLGGGGLPEGKYLIVPMEADDE